MTELPRSWSLSRLDDLCDFNPKHSSGLAKSTLVSFVPMPAIDEVEGRITTPSIRPLGEVWKGFTHFADGDVLFAKITPCMENGKAAIASGLSNGLGCGSTEFHVLRTKGSLDPHYLWRFLRQQTFRDDAAQVMTGAVGQRRVPTDYLRATKIPTPPLDEQRRILTKLDSLTGRTERAREQLDKIPSLIKKYRDAILAAAFSGEMTKDWRRSHRTPEPWNILRISDVADIGSGQTPKGIEDSLTEDGPICWHKVSSMNEPGNEVELSNSRYRLTQARAKELGLRIYPAGTIVFPKRGGAIATNKKRRLGHPSAIDLNLMALKPRRVEPMFLWWWVQKLDLSKLSNGSNVPQINNGDIEPLEIRVPGAEEQTEVVHRIETVFVWLDRVAAEHASASCLLPKLDQAILTKAFKGELVPQDSIDQPVECDAVSTADNSSQRGRPRRAAT